MSHFVFSNTTTIYFGKEKLNNLKNEVRHYGKRVLIVTGGNSVRISGAIQSVMEILDGEIEEIIFFSDILPNPTNIQINEAISIVREKSIDLIIAIGGGSVIDSAKMISAGIYADTDDIWDLVTNKKSVVDVVPMIAIPTTAATGSEMNSGAVITNSKLHIKCGYGNHALQPSAAFYVPEFTMSLSPYQTACGCADIISHIFDSAYFTSYKPMYMLHAVQTQVLRTIFRFAPIAVKDPRNSEARENLMWASAWGLNGFMYENLPQSPACHIIEHQLSANYGITHGHGMAIIMPRWLRYVLSTETASAIAEFGIECMELTSSGNYIKDAEASIDALEYFLFNILGLNPHLSQLCPYQEDLNELAHRICQGRTINSFVSLSEKDVVEILKLCQ